MFTNAENYNHGTGRLSRQLAPLFADFVGVQDGDQVLDVGCGTGSLAFSVAENRRISRIVGIDPSAGFIEYVRSQSTDARLEFQVGDAQNLLFPEASFDKSMALLVIGFFSDAARAVREMRRVTKPGGVVAACWWDVGRDNEFHQRIWDAIISLDPTVRRPTGGAMAYGSPDALSSLWNAVGLTNVEVSGLEFPYESESFEHFLRYQYLQGQGGPAAYVVALPEDRREALKQRFRQDVLGNRPKGSFTIKTKVWGVKGAKP
jgi:ubiquinone/menaquinone biosynthesis C-methylase UbiE